MAKEVKIKRDKSDMITGTFTFPIKEGKYLLREAVIRAYRKIVPTAQSFHFTEAGLFFSTPCEKREGLVDLWLDPNFRKMPKKGWKTVNSRLVALLEDVVSTDWDKGEEEPRKAEVQGAGDPEPLLNENIRRAYCSQCRSRLNKAEYLHKRNEVQRYCSSCQDWVRPVFRREKCH